jgi:heme-degrading monooxygenase HmoA
MYARSTTIQAQASSIDNGIARLRDEVMAKILEFDGCVGLSLMIDRASGRCIVTSSWESEDAMHNSEGGIQSLREDLAQDFGGTVDQIEEWEIAALHREHHASDGTCVRCTWIEGDPGAAERAIEVFKSKVLPKAEMLDGFCSASMLVNRATGRAVAAVAWDNREALEGSREQANKIRASATEEIGARVLDVAEFELAVAHLRVPEMA